MPDTAAHCFRNVAPASIWADDHLWRPELNYMQEDWDDLIFVGNVLQIFCSHYIERLVGGVKNLLKFKIPSLH